MQQENSSKKKKIFAKYLNYFLWCQGFKDCYTERDVTQYVMAWKFACQRRGFKPLTDSEAWKTFGATSMDFSMDSEAND